MAIGNKEHRSKTKSKQEHFRMINSINIKVHMPASLPLIQVVGAQSQSIEAEEDDCMRKLILATCLRPHLHKTRRRIKDKLKIIPHLHETRRMLGRILNHHI